MSVQDTSFLPALPDRARPLRWGYFVVRSLLLALLLLTAAALPSGHGSKDRFRYREGDITRDRVVAPYDFRVEKDETTLRREQAQAAAKVPPVFTIDPRTWEAARAMPKSITTTRPARVSITFSGLTSRCTRPAAWIASSPARNCEATSRAS